MPARVFFEPTHHPVMQDRVSLRLGREVCNDSMTLWKVFPGSAYPPLPSTASWDCFPNQCSPPQVGLGQVVIVFKCNTVIGLNPCKSCALSLFVRTGGRKKGWISSNREMPRQSAATHIHNTHLFLSEFRLFDLCHHHHRHELPFFLLPINPRALFG